MFTQLNKKLTLSSSFKTAPNIGLIKYWGKWNEREIIPLNTNIGVTLNPKDIFTTTTLTLNPETDKNQLLINGKDFHISNRIERLFGIFREQILQSKQFASNKYKNSPSDKPLGQVIPDIEKYGIRVESNNSFPTGSGLASSSSGLSALALCLQDILKTDIDVRYLSRIGSGSACRCLYGNLVLFPETISLESKRCLPYEVQSSKWLKDKVSIVILTDTHQGQKDVLSKDGMKLTWETSKLIQGRVRQYVEQHITELQSALEKQDFNKVMEIIIKDSNQFHATCMDTYPPLLYLNDFSRQIIKMVHIFNRNAKHIVGYTFDAGAHAVLLIHNDELQSFKKFLSEAENLFTKQKYIIPSQQFWTSIGEGPINLN
ncbi:unnamed protein product (macronuclear) [Paramecium tetraurelia]|uniref:Diphosphomevalonate decarboxylase n=1 Tax=Paramecium tetraurelia TaxID=5888 RepID=A0CNB5_PARTE|nr:uncharacterized protein GSPATT00008724001 [Paramecium tetraurelia]CAK72282.1 unnamed protein product [Paramecium tetraurelia]|eukprot:XP_001439679.1 hypothetical protein (macronuclear) [Paramecium tetraurelia strain d4-2]